MPEIKPPEFRSINRLKKDKFDKIEDLVNVVCDLKLSLNGYQTISIDCRKTIKNDESCRELFYIFSFYKASLDGLNKIVKMMESLGVDDFEIQTHESNVKCSVSIFY